MYCEDVSLIPTTKSYFIRNIFNACYNFGFSSPRTDVCSTCLQLMESIKGEMEKRKKNIDESHVHKLCTKSFFNLFKEEKPGDLALTFDCQRNQPPYWNFSSVVSSSCKINNLCSLAFYNFRSHYRY